MKLLWYSDFLVPTGFGNVAEEIISRLITTGKYDITVLAINHIGEPYNHPSSPYYKFKDLPVYPAGIGGDLLGRARLIELLSKNQFDILFALQDTFNMASFANDLSNTKKARNFKYFYYFPVDAHLNPQWVTDSVLLSDGAFTYTNYGQQTVKRAVPTCAVGVLPHGVDFNTFRPLDKNEALQFKQSYFGLKNEFLVTNINRNQTRKDIPSTLLAWLKVKQEIPDAYLYLHMPIDDPAGYNLNELVHSIVPTQWTPYVLLARPLNLIASKETMRMIYGASDVIVTTTLGEGWGLSITEAMACGVPVVAPRHTACQEIIGENEERGYLAKIAGQIVLSRSDNSRVRPLVDVNDMAQKILQVKAGQGTHEKVEAALSWVKSHCDWDKIVEKWDIILGGK